MGWFGAAKNIMGTLLAPAIILGAAEFPRLSRAASDVATFKTEVRAALRPILWLGALGGVGSVLFADMTITMVYGQRNFAPAGTILKVYGPGLFLLFVDVLLGNALTAMGRATALSVAKIGSVLLSIALDLILIPIFQKGTGNGGIGVVVAFAASEAVVFAGALFLLPRGSLGPSVAFDVGRALGGGSHHRVALPLDAAASAARRPAPLRAGLLALLARARAGPARRRAAAPGASAQRIALAGAIPRRAGAKRRHPTCRIEDASHIA
jgi:hypothetical protein